MATVYFASSKVKKIEANATLPAKFERLLKETGKGGNFEKKKVLIKMHVGSGIGYTTIHPLFVRILADYVKRCSGEPFLTDVSGYDVKRGYTPEVTGCRTYPATGLKDRNYFTKKLPEGNAVKELQVAGIVRDGEYLINFSHSKGHGHSGYGGAIKNLGMGLITAKSRGEVHNTMHARPVWDKKLCKHCRLCVKNCRNDVITFRDDGQLDIDFHGCVFCMRCAAVCPTKALKLDMANYAIFQKTLALSAKTVLEEFRGKFFHVNVLLNVTPFCDCWGFSTPAIIPDTGILASDDIVALETASLDLIDRQKYIPGTLPGHLKVEKRKGHLFERIWGKDPYVQVREAESLGLGETKYSLVEIN